MAKVIYKHIWKNELLKQWASDKYCLIKKLGFM